MTELLFSQVIYPVLWFRLSHRGVSSKAFYFPKAEQGYMLLNQETTNSCGDSGGPAKGSKVLPWSLSQNRAWHVYSSTRIWSSYNSDTGVSITVAPKVPGWGMVGVKHTDTPCECSVVCVWDTYRIERQKLDLWEAGGEQRCSFRITTVQCRTKRIIWDAAGKQTSPTPELKSSLQSPFLGQSPPLIIEIKAMKRIHHTLLFAVSISHLLT